jgi:hypothetical protein
VSDIGARRTLLNRRPARTTFGWRASCALAVRILAAAAFALDAYVHATNAGIYDPPGGGLVTEGNLFRAEALAAGLVALALLLRPSRRVWLAAVAIAASALGAVVLYRYVDVGAIGPIPNLYEPTWQVPGKLLSAYAEGAALLLSALSGLRPAPTPKISSVAITPKTKPPTCAQ